MAARRPRHARTGRGPFPERAIPSSRLQRQVNNGRVVSQQVWRNFRPSRPAAAHLPLSNLLRRYDLGRGTYAVVMVAIADRKSYDWLILPKDVQCKRLEKAGDWLSWTGVSVTPFESLCFIQTKGEVGEAQCNLETTSGRLISRQVGYGSFYSAAPKKKAVAPYDPIKYYVLLTAFTGIQNCDMPENAPHLWWARKEVVQSSLLEVTYKYLSTSSR